MLLSPFVKDLPYLKRLFQVLGFVTSPAGHGSSLAQMIKEGNSPVVMIIFHKFDY